MQRRTSLYVMAGAVVPFATAVGIALATPPSGITPEQHVAGAKLAKGAKVNTDGIKFQTKRPADVSVLTLTLDPGGTTGWHSHPGFAIISVTQGTQTLYARNCSSRTYSAGESFVETGRQPMVARNETNSEVVLVVTFVAPKGVESFRIDQPNPGCPGID